MAEPTGVAPAAWRRRAARWLMAAAIPLGLLFMLRSAPREQHLILVTGSERRQMAELELVWEAVGRPDLTGGSRWKWPSGAPARVPYGVSVPPGDYQITLLVTIHERGAGASRSIHRELVRQVTLDGDSVAIPLEPKRNREL